MTSEIDKLKHFEDVTVELEKEAYEEMRHNIYKLLTI